MELISTNDDYEHPYLHHRNVLNPYTSAYAHRDFLGEDFGPDDESYCPEDEETGQATVTGNDDEEKNSSYQKRYRGDEEYIPSSPSCPKQSNDQQERYPCGDDNEGKSDDHQKSAPDVKMGDVRSSLEEKLSGHFDQLKTVTMKRLKNVSEFCSWNCFFSLLFVVGVLLVFLDHYGSAYVRMMNMQKFFFFVMGVLTTTVAVVVVCVVVAFTSCYGGDTF